MKRLSLPSPSAIALALRPHGWPRRRLAGAAIGLLVMSASCSAAQTATSTAPPRASVEGDSEAWRATPPAPGPARSFQYPSAQVARLPNGVEIYLVPKQAGTVALSVSTRAGGRASGPGRSGLAALTLRMMTEATVHKDALALAIAAESLGASLDYDSGRDGSSLSMEVLPVDVSAGLALLSEVITAPRFDADDFDRIKKQWRDSLVSERQDPVRLSSLAGLRAVLGPEAAAPVRGSVPDVERLTREQLQSFHREHYVAGNLAVLAVGDLTLERLTELVKQSFGHLPPATAPARPPLELPPAPSAVRVWVLDRPGSVQSALFAGQVFPKRSAPGHEARQVMNNLLGGLFTSRLNLNLREQHAYTYGARSVAIATQDFGVWIAMSSVKTESTADALEQLMLELKALKNDAPNPIGADELERAKTDLIHRLGASLEHVRRMLGDTGELYVDRLGPDYHTRYPALLSALDRDAVRAQAARLTPERLAVVIVGDEQRIAPLLAAKGWSVQAAPPAFTE